MPRVPGLAQPVQHKHAVIADAGEARGDAGGEFGRLLVRRKAPRAVEQAKHDQPGHGVHQPRSAKTGGLAIADYLQLHVLRRHRNGLDRPVSGPHAASDRRSLECRARRRRGREQPVAAPGQAAPGHAAPGHAAPSFCGRCPSATERARASATHRAATSVTWAWVRRVAGADTDSAAMTAPPSW